MSQGQNLITQDQSQELASTQSPNILVNLDEFSADEDELDMSLVNSELEKNNHYEIQRLKGQINDLHTGMVDLINIVNKNIEPLLQQQAWLPQKEKPLSIVDQFKLAKDILPKFVRHTHDITPTSHIEGTIEKGTFPEIEAASFNKDALLFLKRERTQIKNLSSQHIYKIMYEDLQVRTQGRVGSKKFYQGIMLKQQEFGPGGRCF
jgi:hypothetical protein